MPTVKKRSSGRRVAGRQKVSRDHESRHQLYPRVTVNTVPDEVLLEIFNFYLVTPDQEPGREDAWHTLVHVCRRWRFVVFASPQRLQLRLVCTNKRPVQKTLDIWPELPIVIKGRRGMSIPQGANNIIAALKQQNRVCEIDIDFIPNAFLKRMHMRKMRNPFTALTSLRLHSEDINAPALPDSFLGGSARRLQTLTLSGVPFPALPKLLLSTRDLVVLCLWDIPPSGYISPGVMITSLSALSRLEKFYLQFRSPRSQADRENRLLPRIALPALTDFELKGDSGYLEDIVAQVDTPLLKWFHITFFNQLGYYLPLLRHFISRTETFKAPHRADVCFYDATVFLKFYRQDETSDHHISSFAISCGPSFWQLSTLAQLCNSALSPLTTLERLEVQDCGQRWKGDEEDTPWHELLHPVTSVKDLVLRGKLVQLVTPTLEERVGESGTEVLPTLQNIFLQGPQPSEPVMKVIAKFVAARQLSGRPVAVHHRNLERDSWQQVHWEVSKPSVNDKCSLLFHPVHVSLSPAILPYTYCPTPLEPVTALFPPSP